MVYKKIILIILIGGIFSNSYTSNSHDASKDLIDTLREIDRSLLDQVLNDTFELSYDFDTPLTLLMLTVILGAYDLGAILLALGANPNIQDSEGQTALMCSLCHFSCGRIIPLLLNYGANPNIQDKEGVTALMKAVQFSNIGVVKLLIEAGADPYIEDYNGLNSYDYIEEFVQDNHVGDLIFEILYEYPV